jgi:hypothetical protein
MRFPKQTVSISPELVKGNYREIIKFFIARAKTAKNFDRRGHGISRFFSFAVGV